MNARGSQNYLLISRSSSELK